MPTISGTATSAPGTVLLSELADHIQANHLDDAGETYFTQSQVEEWINDAIADFSQHLPRRRTDTITTTADDRKYDLESDFVAALSVEYPTGEDPPEYLKRRPYTHADFWSEDGYYDIIGRDDDGNADELWMSEKPAASETITVEYLATHDHDLTSSEEITVPIEYHHVLTLYVLWQAAKELEAAEEQNPTSNSSLLMSMLAQGASQYKRDYDGAIRALKKQRSGRSRMLVWDLDVGDGARIY